MFKMNPYLRIVVNTDCNFNCFFCHHEGEPLENLHKELPIEIPLQLLKNNLFSKVKITGGEPLLRKDIISLIKKIRLLTNGKLSITTNGYLLKDKAKALKEAGLDYINVSLHSLDRKTFKDITGVDGLETVLEGIDEASKYFDQIRINSVIGKYNYQEIDDLIDYCSNNNLTLKVLCLMPLTDELAKKAIPKEELINLLSLKAQSVTETFDKYFFNFGKTTVEMKKTILYEKCKVCEFYKKCVEGIYATRLNVNGELKECLYK